MKGECSSHLWSRDSGGPRMTEYAARTSIWYVYVCERNHDSHGGAVIDLYRGLDDSLRPQGSAEWHAGRVGSVWFDPAPKCWHLRVTL